MAEIKDPNTTRPFRMIPAGATGPVTGRTQPFAVPASGRTQPIPVPSSTGTSQALPREAPAKAGPTEGMLARRREIERKKRAARLERERLEEEAREGWKRVFRAVWIIALLGGAAYLYWRVQSTYGNEWPMGAVWIMLGTFLFGGIFLLLWYLNRTEW